MIRKSSAISTIRLWVTSMWVLEATILCSPILVAADVSSGFRLGGFEFVGEDLSRLNVGVGGFDVFQLGDPAIEGRLELRLGKKRYTIGPLLGVMANIEGGVFGYAGIYTDIRRQGWVVTPSIGLGGYSQGDSKDQGEIFQFRFGIEMARELDDGGRLGIGLTHISNADIHGSNPGAESVFLFYSVPLGQR